MYPTTEELVASSEVSALTEASPEEQDRLRRSSIAAVEDYCQQKFDSWVGTKRVQGSGLDVLYLPRRLSALTGLVVARSGLTEAVVALDEDHASLAVLPGSAGGGNYYERCSRAADGEEAWDFTFGYGTVSVTGVWGWADDEFPQEVADAILRDMEDTALVDKNKLTPTIRQYRHLGVRDLAQGNMRVTMSGAPGLSAEAMNLVAGFVWSGQMGALA